MTLPRDHVDLRSLAIACMRARGFEPGFEPQVQAQLTALASHPPPVAPGAGIRDLRSLLWSSIDNDTSRDLDQLEICEALPDGRTRTQVAIADVDAWVARHSAIDDHAAQQTTSVYTGIQMFPMLPEALSTDATSLLEGRDRSAIVIEFVVGQDGAVESGDVYRAIVCNKAQLAYDGVGAWLERRGPAPASVAASAALQAQLALQDTCAQTLSQARHRHGALNIETIETHPVLSDGRVVDIARQNRNRATTLIEDFMIAANEVVSRLLKTAGLSSIQRVVKSPERWDRIVALAATAGGHLPAAPDAAALNDFLNTRQAADPDHFADLSLTVIKLLGPGEYVLERASDPPVGHFGLAVRDYTHSTAPNRRFADLATQRLLKAMIAHAPAPYTDEELTAIAQACTLKEDAARKVERDMSKRISAVAMSGRIGQTFDAIVTGVTPSGTFVRVITPHVEGLLVQGQRGADVGDRLRVTLVRTDPERGYIDFTRAA
jgi:VacB/RNase II family 3'-5' exoribonuclease